MIPSIKTLSHFGDKAQSIRSLMERFVNRHPLGGVSPETTLGKISDLIGGHGVEYIASGSGPRSPAITYVNMGDTYDTTVIWVNGRFRVGCWGDIVERGSYD